jgi:hypothetical protein
VCKWRPLWPPPEDSPPRSSSITRQVEKRWYEAGLAFACTRCGNCCTGAPGTVLVTPNEIARLANAVELDRDAFRAIYTRRISGEAISLREKSDGSCVLYDPEQGCTVYRSRPRQCETFPFWRGIVASASAWESESRTCPGLNRGPIRSADEVDAISCRDGTFSSARVRILPPKED